MFCREQVAQLCDVQGEIEGRGAKLVVVGNGGAHFARAFVAERDVTFPVYVDPELGSYRAAGLKRGVKTTFRGGVMKSAARALMSGHLQGLTQGDAWQQGGVFVIAPAGDVRFAYVSEEAGDHPPVADILAALPS